MVARFLEYLAPIDRPVYQKAATTRRPETGDRPEAFVEHLMEAFTLRRAS